MTERDEMEAVLEAVLFVSSEPVPRARLLDLFDEEERAQAEEALEAVLARYSGGAGGAGEVVGAAGSLGALGSGDAGDALGALGANTAGDTYDRKRGIMAEEVAGGVRLATRPEMVSYLRRFFDVTSGSKLSMASLETLAIIAYRQPITGPEIQELRSVSPSGVIKTLLEKRLVRIVGRKEVVGKPFLYGTTREFLVHFGLNTLKDLPPLEEFEETFGSMVEGGGEGGGGGEPGILEGREDREEQILREAAAIEEAAADLPEEPPELPEEPAEETEESVEPAEGSAATAEREEHPGPPETLEEHTPDATKDREDTETAEEPLADEVEV
jgi:segregation and condensation protein B